MPTFTYQPDNMAQLTENPRVLRAQFGDGYMQRVGDGININPRKYQLSFNTRSTAEIAPIVAFLEAQNGIYSFDWTPPDGVAGKWITPDGGWTHTFTRFGIHDLSVVFQEVYEP
jgi:phage-related protein